MTQFGLFDSSAQRQFEEFHRNHPEVYASIVRYARQAKNSGFKTFGLWAIWNRMRWFMYIETTGTDYKLNNNFIAYYARFVMQSEPDLAGFFEIRSMKGGEPDFGAKAA